ncbi:MAG: FliI/YscN family ATPase [Oscillospiraceae bacterium]|jgi:flagellum-specific ATP synthase|nr:FliI/YscN family ATPase [Oscillospiraceae bacterium]
MFSERRIDFAKYRSALAETDTLVYRGHVTKIVGLMIQASGPHSRIGDICNVYPLEGGDYTQAEIVGFDGTSALLMPLGVTEGIGLGSDVVYTKSLLHVPVGMSFMGRVLDALGQPMDGLPAPRPDAYYPATAAPPNPLTRARIRDILPLGVKCIDALMTVGQGQRLGIFAGSGVGKSTLLGMMARNAVSDVNVIILVGERGREVRDFIEKDLGEEGLKKSVVVVATSDMPAMLRLKCAMVGTAMAEYFRDQGYKVLMLADSLTRFAMAQREIGMATGEPPVSRGYPPSVLTLMPKLLERTGNNDRGSITALYTVLVEGDDMNEPIADTVRGILDGHIVLSRNIANGNHYPPIDVLASVSRVMPDVVSKEHFKAAGVVRAALEQYREAEDLINIGAYKPGANPDIDRAVRLRPEIMSLTRQETDEYMPFEQTVETLKSIADAQ